MWVVPLSSCHLDSVVWLWTETMAGMCVMCSQVWLQMRGPSVEGTDVSAAPAGWTQTKMFSSLLNRQHKIKFKKKKSLTGHTQKSLKTVLICSQCLQIHTRHAFTFKRKIKQSMRQYIAFTKEILRFRKSKHYEWCQLFTIFSRRMVTIQKYLLFVCIHWLVKLQFISMSKQTYVKHVVKTSI